MADTKTFGGVEFCRDAVPTDAEKDSFAAIRSESNIARAVGIRLSQIFLQKAVFEHVGNPLAMPPNTPAGEIKTVFSARVGVNDDETKGFVELRVASAEDASGLYKFDIVMVGLAEATPESNMSIREYVAKAGPATLYPFIRETVASLSMKGRFGAVWVPPMNFLALSDQLALPPSALPEAAKPEEPKKKPRA